MNKRLKVTIEAKRLAKNALQRRREATESKKFGLTRKDASKLGINSGVARAKQLIKSDSITFGDAKRVCAFSRFLNRKRTFKVQGAIDLWGGEKFIKKACKFTKKE